MSNELLDAVEQRDLARLAALLAAGADPNASHPDSPAWVPLKGAVEELADGGPIEAVVLLLRHGADVDGGRIPGNATPLLVAAMNQQSEAARMLLAAGADPNVRDDEGETPLGLSRKYGNHEMVGLLTLCGAGAATDDGLDRDSGP